MKVIATLTAATLLAFTTAGLASAAAAEPSTPKVDKPRLQAAAKNVRLKASLPGTERAISIAFAQYGPRDVAFVSMETGLKTFDVTDLDKPKLLDHLTKQEMALPGDDPTKRFWENEDINVHLVPRAEIPNFVEQKRAEGFGIDVKLLLFLNL